MYLLLWLAYLLPISGFRLFQRPLNKYSNNRSVKIFPELIRGNPRFSIGKPTAFRRRMKEEFVLDSNLEERSSVRLEDDAGGTKFRKASVRGRDYPKLTYEHLSEQDKYDLQWYVIGTPFDFPINAPQKVTVWNKKYVVWRNETGHYNALDNGCPHKGASLAGGYIQNGSVVCPYHGYEFDCNGELSKVPGICFTPSPVQNVGKYATVEKHGWVYLNICSFFSESALPILGKESRFCDASTLHRGRSAKPSEPDQSSMKGRSGVKAEDPSIISKGRSEGVLWKMKENIFVEEEANRNNSVVFLDMDFNCYSRILSENSLDVMHIGFVHTFGNTKNPAPIEIHPPRPVRGLHLHHFKTSYTYEAGENSIARKIFKVNDLIIENEFILPHTTVARVIFGDYVSTVITFALPLSESKSRLFVKTYRNFWQNPVGDKISSQMMYQTMLQDRVIVENIDPLLEDGKFNMKFDKLQNTYKTFYQRFIHRKNNG